MPRRKAVPAADPTACVIYARYSSLAQREESIEDQVRVCTDYAESHGLTVAKVYADKHISGTTDDRPAFLEMIRDASAGSWARVLVYKLDRFARNRFDAAVYRRKLQDAGVQLVSVVESIPDGPEGAILESVLEGFNEYYSRNLSQNTLRGMNGNAERCMANGVPVWGYDVGADGRYEVNQHEAELVREAFDRYLSGSPSGEIVSWLSREGVRTSTGKKPSTTWLASRLRDERYVGTYHWGDVRVEHGMPAIVDDAVWQQVQPMIDGRQKPRSHEYLLAGIAYDAQTGARYAGSNATSHSGRTYFYYQIKVDGQVVRIPRDRLDDAVAKSVSSALADPDLSRTLAEQAVEIAREAGESQDVIWARGRLREIAKANDNILKAVEMGIVPDGTAERLEELRTERASLEARLSAAEAAVPDVDLLQMWIARLGRAGTDRETLRRAVLRVIVDRENETVTAILPITQDGAMGSGSPLVRTENVWLPRERQTRTGEGVTCWAAVGDVYVMSRWAA